MRAEAEQRHPTPRIRWLADSLPGLTTDSCAGLAADVVSLSAVWQHVAPVDRPQVFRKITGLLRSGGLLAMALRHHARVHGGDHHPRVLTTLAQDCPGLSGVVAHRPWRALEGVGSRPSTTGVRTGGNHLSAHGGYCVAACIS
jgi:hypothetical protein